MPRLIGVRIRNRQPTGCRFGVIPIYLEVGMFFDLGNLRAISLFK
jgi:hypothetical protein